MHTISIPQAIVIVSVFILVYLYLARKRKNIKQNDDLIDILDECGFSDKPICSFSIKNNSNEPKDAFLFGLSNFFQHKNFGSNDGIEINSLFCNVNYMKSLIDSGFNPFMFNMIKTEVSGQIEKQFNNDIYYTNIDAKGNLLQEPFKQEGGNRESEECVKILFDKYYEINHNSYLSITVEGNTEVFISLYKIDNMDESIECYPYPKMHI